MTLDGFSIRNMTRQELDLALEWASDEGVNPGLRDATPFYEADPEGFFVGEFEGEVVGVIAGVSYKEFGYVGLHIVRKDMRGKGFGRALWEHAMERLSGMNVGLDGFIQFENKYKDAGFRTYYRNIRYKWSEPPDPCVSERLVPIEDVPFEEILEFDRECFPAGREEFLKQWLEMPNATGLAVASGYGLRGFGVVRTCADGCKIGPLFADDCDAAEALLLGLGAAAEQSPVYIDIPEPNSRALRLAKQYSMTPCFETLRMYTKEEPDVEVYKVFGSTTLELG